MALVTHLLRHEVDALADAVRRDMHAEEQRIVTDSVWAEDHRINARLDRDLLEVLKPKHTTR